MFALLLSEGSLDRTNFTNNRFMQKTANAHLTRSCSWGFMQPSLVAHDPSTPLLVNCHRGHPLPEASRVLSTSDEETELSRRRVPSDFRGKQSPSGFLCPHLLEVTLLQSQITSQPHVGGVSCSPQLRPWSPSSSLSQLTANLY